MNRLKELIKAVEILGQGVFIEAVVFHFNNFTVNEIKELEKKYSGWLLIKDDGKIFTDEEIIKKYRAS